MIEAIQMALCKVGIAMALFVGAYLANMLLGLYFNIKILRESFSGRRILASFVKILVFGFAMALLTLTVAILPEFAAAIGWEIPPEYVDIFSVLAICFTFLRMAAKYAAEAFNKFYKILAFDGEELKAAELEDMQA